MLLIARIFIGHVVLRMFNDYLTFNFISVIPVPPLD